jgi:hypothetical protein
VTPEEAVQTVITDAGASATSIMAEGIPIVLGVAVLWVSLTFGMRLMRNLEVTGGGGGWDSDYDWDDWDHGPDDWDRQDKTPM